MTGAMQFRAGAGRAPPVVASFKGPGNLLETRDDLALQPVYGNGAKFRLRRTLLRRVGRLNLFFHFRSLRVEAGLRAAAFHGAASLLFQLRPIQHVSSALPRLVKAASYLESWFCSVLREERTDVPCRSMGRESGLGQNHGPENISCAKRSVCVLPDEPAEC